MMKEIVTFVSGAVAVATEPGVAIAAIAGWFGHRWWARWREKRRISGREENGDKQVEATTEIDTRAEQIPEPEQSASENRTNEKEELGPEELSPRRVEEEIVIPVLRGLEAIVKDVKKQGMGCTAWVTWRGATSDGTDWRDSFNSLSDFKAKRYGPSAVVTVDLELHIKRNRYPAKSAPVAWRGDFGSKSYKMIGTWRRGPSNILRAMLLDDPDPIPAQNVTSLLQLIEEDVNYVIASWETREPDGEENSRGEEC